MSKYPSINTKPFQEKHSLVSEIGACWQNIFRWIKISRLVSWSKVRRFLSKYLTAFDESLKFHWRICLFVCVFVYLAAVGLHGQLLHSLKAGVLSDDKRNIRVLCGRTCVCNNCLATEVLYRGFYMPDKLEVKLARILTRLKFPYSSIKFL